MITSKLNKLNIGFLSVLNLVPWLIFSVNILGVRAWILTDQFCWIRLHFNATGRGLKKRKDGERGRSGRLFEGGDYFRYFRLRGWLFDRGRRLIEERLLFDQPCPQGAFPWLWRWGTPPPKAGKSAPWGRGFYNGMCNQIVTREIP